MFISYNLAEFGEKMKNLRKDVGLSQLDIQSSTGVSVDALRRIEKGEVIPRYETLELLSTIYKQDLLELLKSCRANKLLTEYHDELDDLITCFDAGKMKAVEADIRKNFSDSTRMAIVNPTEVIQLLMLMRGSALYHSRISNDREDARYVLTDALKLTMPTFSTKKYKSFNYSYIELRILLLISILIAEKNEIDLSNEILHFILEKLKDNNPGKYVDFLIIKIYSNLCYNHHLQDHHEEVIRYAQEGIDYCRRNETTYGLNLLYYRKGIAEYELQNADYMDSLQAAFFLLKLSGQDELLEVYLEVTRQKYNILIPDTPLIHVKSEIEGKKTKH